MAKTKRPNDRRGDGDPIGHFRKAWVQWEALRTRCDLGLVAGTPDGRMLRVTYQLPDSRAMRIQGDYAERTKFGMVPVPWANLLHPAARPTDRKWKAAYDATAAARKLLADAADKLGASLQGNGDEARDMRKLAANLASRLRGAPWVWRTAAEVEAANAIERGLGRYEREVAEEARKAEEAKQRAAAIAHAVELHEADLRWIAWTRTLPSAAGKRGKRGKSGKGDELTYAQVLILREIPASTAKSPAMNQRAIVRNLTDKGTHVDKSTVSRAVWVLRELSPPLIHNHRLQRTLAGDRKAEHLAEE